MSIQYSADFAFQMLPQHCFKATTTETVVPAQINDMVCRFAVVFFCKKNC